VKNTLIERNIKKIVNLGILSRDEIEKISSDKIIYNKLTISLGKSLLKFLQNSLEVMVLAQCQ
jgi:hypothetical protein